MGGVRGCRGRSGSSGIGLGRDHEHPAPFGTGGRITRLEATSDHRDLLRLDLALFPFTPFAERIWALRNNLSSHDAWYVALAEALGCPLLTLDASGLN